MKSNSTDAEALRQLTNLLQAIRDPIRFRVASLSLIGCLMMGIYWPLSTELESVGGRYVWQFQKSELIRDLDQVKGAAERLKPFLPPKEVDIPWWLSRLRTGAKEAGVKMSTFSYSQDKGSVSGYPGMGSSMTFTGTMNTCITFIAWLESHKPILRLDKFSMTSLKADPNTIQVSISVAMLLNPEAP